MPRKFTSKEQHRQDNYRTRYGLTVADVAVMLTKQQGVCAICKTPPKRPCVDHCHRTNRVRGILCHKCNIALHAIERESFFTPALDYLLEHGMVGGPPRQ